MVSTGANFAGLRRLRVALYAQRTLCSRQRCAPRRKTQWRDDVRKEAGSMGDGMADPRADFLRRSGPACVLQTTGSTGSADRRAFRTDLRNVSGLPSFAVRLPS